MLERSEIEKIESYIEYNSTPEEERYIYKLICENEQNDTFRKWMKDKFYNYFKESNSDEHDLTPLYHKLYYIIQEKENKRNKTRIRQIFQWYAKAAAVILLPLLFTVGISLYKNYVLNSSDSKEFVQTSLIAPLGSRINFTFPDGTICWLNSGSQIEYSIPFNKNRKIKLTGEAWFDVAHFEANPFEVNAGNTKVTVHGTKFNLSAYPDEKFVEVALEEGKVSFSSPGITSGIEMKPNERLVLRENRVNIYQEDVIKYGAWREGKLIFRGDSMEEVAKRIERWYNVDVVLADDILIDYRIRGTFQDDTIEDVMKYLSMTSPISYKIVERVEQTDGLIDKKKIIIYAKQIDN